MKLIQLSLARGPIKVSMLADNSGSTRLHQKDRRAAEAFQFAAILAWHATLLRERVFKPRESVPVSRDGGHSMWGVTLQKRKWFGPIDNLREAQKKGAPTSWVMERFSTTGSSGARAREHDMASPSHAQGAATIP